MIRIAALNDSDPDSQCSDIYIKPKEPSNEILLEEATRRYTKALEDQSTQNFLSALDIYKSLLDTPLLKNAVHMTDEEKKIPPSGVPPIYSRPVLMLKYACYKNIAEIYRSLSLYEWAYDYYDKASEIDHTDVMLWLSCGNCALEYGEIQEAADAFAMGLIAKPTNQKVLESCAICNFVLGFYKTALQSVAIGFETYKCWITGLALRDIIFVECSYLSNRSELAARNLLNCLCLDEKLTAEQQEQLTKEKDRIKSVIQRIQGIRQNTRPQKKQRTEQYPLIRPLRKLSWIELATSLLHMHEYVSESATTTLGFGTLIELNIIKNEPEETKMERKIEEKVSESKSEEEKGRTKRRTGSALMEELLWSGKRRSARVRTSRKDNDSMSIADALRNILPRTLLHKVKLSEARNIEEKSMDTMDLFRLFEEQEKAKGTKELEKFQKEIEEDRDREMIETGYFNTLQEESDVLEFLEKETLRPVGHIVRNVLFVLQDKWDITWPKVLIDLYLKCYRVMMKSFPSRAYPEQFEIDEEVKKEVGAALLYFELMVDSHEESLQEMLPLKDLHNVIQVINRSDIYYPGKGVLSLRTMWMRSEYYFRDNFTSQGLEDLDFGLHFFEIFPDELNKRVVLLKNLSHRAIVSKEIIEHVINAQERKKSLVTISRLYEEKKYEQLADIISETLNSGVDISKVEEDIVDRQTMINMLINSYFFLENYKDCIYWEEFSAHELLKKPAISEDCQKWIVDLDRILVGIEECCSRGKIEIVDALPSNRLSRFTQTLCHAICKQSEFAERPPCASRPWAILYKILFALENRGGCEKSPKIAYSDEEEDEESDIPPSVLLLFTAHEYLGRREWCNCDGNVLLFLILDQIAPKLRSPEWVSFRETVQQHLEQVVFCLYGHPHRKSKARYLTDHNVSPITLTWDRAMKLFELFRPDIIPSYDSLRVNLINSETEILFRKIASLIPDEHDPAPNSEKMLDFIYGRSNKIPEVDIKLPKLVKDLFYVLGDYYFKTHESAKAMNYLIIDLCSNPDRVDAWASMALSRVSLLECSLNSCDPIKTEEFLEDAMAAIRCYDYCLKLDPSQCTLWIEYGSFAYAVQSFCSQRIKLDSDSVNLEQFEELQTKMLECAKTAFVNANNIWGKEDDEERQDERWLHYYMLGKISEKLKDLEYLEHYEKAAQLLYDNNAQYPKKISYNTPQTLSVEALEVFYRVHACVIKTLELCDGEPLEESIRKQFSKILSIFANGPFVQQISKSDLEKQKKAKDQNLEKVELKTFIKSILTEIISKIPENSQKLEKSVSPQALEVREDAEMEVVEEKTKRYEESDMEVVEEDEKVADFNAYRNVRVVDGDDFPVPEEPPPNNVQNCFLTLEDLQKMGQAKAFKTKKRKRRTRSIASSATSTSEHNIKYDDASSSSASSEFPSQSSSESSDDEEESREKPELEEKSSENENENTFDTEEAMLQQCIKALELCSMRFAQHYKSVYRLAHFYYRSKRYKDLNKCRELLLGHYRGFFGVIGGLFQERKSTNFFNGIWRLPSGDVDRPGNFASHMSRSIVLLLEVLRDLKDHKLLIELSIQLKKTPEPDKKYLREDERKQLSKQALMLCQQTLKSLLKEPVRTDTLIEVFLTYQKVQKHFTGKEAIFAEILVEFYRKLKMEPENIPFDLIIKFCQSERAKLGPVSSSHSPSAVAVKKKRPKLDKQTTNAKKKRMELKLVGKEAVQKIMDDGPMTPTTSAALASQVQQFPSQFTSDFFIQYQKYLALVTQSQPIKRPRGRPPKTPRFHYLPQSPLLSSVFSPLRQQYPFPFSSTPKAVPQEEFYKSMRNLACLEETIPQTPIPKSISPYEAATKMLQKPVSYKPSEPAKSFKNTVECSKILEKCKTIEQKPKDLSKKSYTEPQKSIVPEDYSKVPYTEVAKSFSPESIRKTVIEAHSSKMVYQPPKILENPYAKPKVDEQPKKRFTIDEILGGKSETTSSNSSNQMEAMNLSPDWKYQAYEAAKRSCEATREVWEAQGTAMRKAELPKQDIVKKRLLDEPEIVTIDDD